MVPQKGPKALPAEAVTIVADVDDDGTRLKPSTVKPRLCALWRTHNLCNLGEPSNIGTL